MTEMNVDKNGGPAELSVGNSTKKTSKRPFLKRHVHGPGCGHAPLSDLSAPAEVNDQPAASWFALGKKPWNWDKLGIGLSSLCLVHCIVTPLVIVLLPAFETHLHSFWFHGIMAVLILPTAVLSFVHGYLQHRIYRALAFGVLGTLIVSGALLLPEEFVDQIGHVEMTVVGSVLLMIGHVINFRACRHGHHRRS